MDGSGYAALAAAVLMGGAFGFFLPGYMLVYAIQDGNYRAAIVFIVWIAIATWIVIKIFKYIWGPKKEE